MIWIFDINPRVNAYYYPDDLIKVTIKKGIQVLRTLPPSKYLTIWVYWTHKRSQNWLWFFQFIDALEDEHIHRFQQSYKTTDINQIWQCPINYPPCHHRGLLGRFPLAPGVTPTNFKNKKSVVHAYRKTFNEENSTAQWEFGKREPFWYYGNCG